MSAIPPAQQEVLEVSYEQWRQHPITKELINNLKKHREKFIKELSNNSMKNNTVSDADIRHYAVNIYSIDTVLELITNYKKFIDLSQK